jgi:hypothetical protein
MYSPQLRDARVSEHLGSDRGVGVDCTHPQLRDARVSENLGSDHGVGVDVLTPSLEMPESVNILALTVGLG